MKKPNWRNWIENKNDCKAWLDSYINKEIIVKSEGNEKLHYNKAEHNANLSNWLNSKQDDLRTLFDDVFYDWVINSSYYASYHAALALVSKLKFKSKSHAATLCFIIYYYFHDNKLLEKEHLEIVANALNKDDIEIITNSKSLRERASYNIDESFEKGIADDVRKNSLNFINKVRGILEL